jgi:hypothetical protein
MSAGPVSTATCALSRPLVLDGRAGVMSRPGQLRSVCDHAVISELGVQTSGCALQPPPGRLIGRLFRHT